MAKSKTPARGSKCAAAEAVEIDGQACCPECEKHNICGAKKTKRGGICHKSAGWNTPHKGFGHCRLHGGMTQSHQQQADRDAAERAVIRFGLRRDIAPHDALLEAVHRAAYNVREIEAVLAQIDRERLTHGIVKTVQLPDGKRRVEAAAARSVWLDLYGEWHDRLVRAAAEAIRCKVAERQVEIVKRQAEQLARVVTAILSDLGHDLTDSRTREVVRLRMIEGGAGEDEEAA
jgi:hypothetical protein